MRCKECGVHEGCLHLTACSHRPSQLEYMRLRYDGLEPHPRMGSEEGLGALREAYLAPWVEG